MDNFKHTGQRYITVLSNLLSSRVFCHVKMSAYVPTTSAFSSKYSRHTRAKLISLHYIKMHLHVQSRNLDQTFHKTKLWMLKPRSDILNFWPNISNCLNWVKHVYLWILDQTFPITKTDSTIFNWWFSTKYFSISKTLANILINNRDPVKHYKTIHNIYIIHLNSTYHSVRAVASKNFAMGEAKILRPLQTNFWKS